MQVIVESDAINPKELTDLLEQHYECYLKLATANDPIPKVYIRKPLSLEQKKLNNESTTGRRDGEL